MKDYIKSCNICERTKISRHKSYDELRAFSIATMSWKEIIINFVTSLSSSKRREVVYDLIFVIIDRCIKMIKYIFVIKKIDVAQLTKVLFEEIVLRFDMSDEIVSDKDFVFTSAFWSTICFHARIRRRLSSAFYSQTNELIERQNQMLEHYLRCFANKKQINWANLLLLVEFVYNNNHHAFVDASSFYLLYKYHLEIKYHVENNFFKEKISSTTERIQQLQTLRQTLKKRLLKTAKY